MQGLKDKPRIKGPHSAKVLRQEQISADTFRIYLENETIAKNAKPGQFASVLCSGLTLRRPFSIAKTNNNTFEIIYKVKGQGTKFISELREDNIVDLIAPLGNGYCIENKKSLIIGCGVGVAPILFLSQALDRQNIKYSAILCSKTNLNLEKEFNRTAYTITEDGSSRFSGKLNDYLESIIESDNPEKIYICGPNAAMKYVVGVATKNNIPVEVAMEREFACGTGVCMGCTIEIIQDGQRVQKRICKNGPVFNGVEVVWK